MTKHKIQIVISVAILVMSFAFAQAEEETFIYDSMGRRDPFIPLLDKDSPTQLRTVFIPPVLELPVEIKIKGILWSGREFFAIVNGEVRKKGDSIDGIRIKAIEEDRVILGYLGKEYTIFLRRGTKE
jgi:hypothetical protein